MADDKFEIDQETYEMASNFFKNDYHDRGMVKWQGFFLSDHLEDHANNKAKEEKAMAQTQMPNMSEEAISEVLFNAYRKMQTIDYQLKGMTFDGLYPEIQTGKVKGYADSTIIIGKKKVELDQLNWCKVS